MGKSESRKVFLKIPSEIKIGISVIGQKNANTFFLSLRCINKYLKNLPNLLFDRTMPTFFLQ